MYYFPPDQVSEHDHDCLPSCLPACLPACPPACVLFKSAAAELMWQDKVTIFPSPTTGNTSTREHKLKQLHECPLVFMLLLCQESLLVYQQRVIQRAFYQNATGDTTGVLSEYNRWYKGRFIRIKRVIQWAYYQNTTCDTTGVLSKYSANTVTRKQKSGNWFTFYSWIYFFMLTLVTWFF